MDTSMNYQTLAQAIVMSAIEDAQGDGPDAFMANQWLSGVDLETLGVGDMTSLGNDTPDQQSGWERNGNN